jgi:hypothetical protein
MLFANPPGPGWADPQGNWDAKGPFTAPLPKEWSRYRGHYVYGDRAVFSYTVNARDVLEGFITGTGPDGKPAHARYTNVLPGQARVEQAPHSSDEQPLTFGADTVAQGRVWGPGAVRFTRAAQLASLVEFTTAGRSGGASRS